jgi:hypothetical protein
MFSDELLQSYRLKTDTLADEIVAKIFANNEASQVREVMQLLVRNDTQPDETVLSPYLVQYFKETEVLPTWADKKQLEKSVSFFEQNIENIMTLLGVYSLPYCYAAADGARVLQLSKRIIEQTRKRLAETAQFVLEVMHPDAFLPQGKAIRSIQKVRLMHAVVRYQILNGGKWDLAWGKPINQEDMAGTNLSFSFIILQGLRKIGTSVSFEEAQAFLHHWAMIGYMLGLDEKLLVFQETQANILCKMIEKRSFKSSEHGINLSAALLESFKTTFPFNLLKGLAATYVRYLVGDEYSNMLEIPKADWTNNIISVLKIRNTYRSINPFSKEEVSKNVETYTKMILELSEETKFIYNH